MTSTTQAPALHFACNQCGKCCNSGPSLSLAELFTYSRDFIIGLRFQGQHIAHDGAGLTLIKRDRISEFKEHLRRFSPVVSTLTHETFINIFPVVAGYSTVEGNHCEALQSDKRCALEANKPAMCRAAPFDPVVPQSLQGPIAQRLKEFGCVRTESFEGSRPLYAEEKIVDTTFLKGYDERLQGLIDDDYLVSMITQSMREDLPFLPSLEALQQAVEAGSWIETSLAPVLFVIAFSRKDYIPVMANLIEEQMLLIERSIAEALYRKNKNERARTQLLRGYLDDYRTVLYAFQSGDIVEMERENDSVPSSLHEAISRYMQQMRPLES